MKPLHKWKPRQREGYAACVRPGGIVGSGAGLAPVRPEPGSSPVLAPLHGEGPPSSGATGSRTFFLGMTSLPAGSGAADGGKAKETRTWSSLP